MIKKLLIAGIFITAALQVTAQSIDAYYMGTSGLSGLKLKARLHQILIKQTVSWNYGDLPAIYQITDRDSFYENDGSLLDLYAENPDGPDSYNYYYEIPSLVSGAGTEGEGWNREHIVSQSFFYSNYPMYSDLHFVIPTDARVNQRRSNLPFGKVNASPAFISLNGSKVGNSVSPGYTLSVFEPIDEFKGDIARMLLYAAVRYEKLMPTFDYINGRSPFQEHAEIGLKSWMLQQLIQWHINDPVSERELNRNNHIYHIQGNRNPFIDHPEWVQMIWNDGVIDTEAPEKPIYLEVVRKGKSFVHIHWADAADIDVLGYEVYINDTLHSKTHLNYFVFTDLPASTSYSVKLRAYDHKYNYSIFSNNLSIHTTATDTFSSNLYFSKVIEGTANNKAIELYNNTGYPVDLKHYTIGMRQINGTTGAMYWSDNTYQMEGVVAHGARVVLMNPKSNLECLPIEDAAFITAATPLTFAGDLALSLNKNGTTIDYFGAPSNREPFAQDESWYRKPSIMEPNTVFTPAEWLVFPTNYCEGLGIGNPVSVLSPIDIQDISIYPNPATNYLMIDISKSSSPQNEVTLYNQLGKEVGRYTLSNRVHQLSLHHLPSGVYTISLLGYNYNFTILK